MNDRKEPFDNFNFLSKLENLRLELQNKINNFGKTYEPPITLEAEKLKKIAADVEIEAELKRLKHEIYSQEKTKKHNTSSQNRDYQHKPPHNDKIMLCYSIFGLKPGASLIEVKQAHRKLIKKYHPDLFFDNPQRQQQAEEMMKKINQAYTKLCTYIKERSHL